MNKKFVIKGTNIPVKEGDSVTLGNVTKEDLEYLVKTGVLVANDEITLENVITSIAIKLGKGIESTTDFLNNLSKVNPAVVFSLLLKELAITLDKQYEGHITKCSNLYFVRASDGSVDNLWGRYNPDTIALFRNYADARLAVNILKPYWNKVWGE